MNDEKQIILLNHGKITVSGKGSTMKEYAKVCSCLVIITLIFSFIMCNRYIEKNNSKTIETELTIIDKNIKTVFISTGKSVVPVKQYELTVDFGGEEHTVSVGQDAYNSINVGNSAMFICYYNGKLELVDICLGE